MQRCKLPRASATRDPPAPSSNASRICDVAIEAMSDAWTEMEAPATVRKISAFRGLEAGVDGSCEAGAVSEVSRECSASSDITPTLFLCSSSTVNVPGKFAFSASQKIRTFFTFYCIAEDSHFFYFLLQRGKKSCT